MSTADIKKQGEVFHFLAASFDVDRAKDLIAEGKARLVKIDPKDMMGIIGMIRIDKDRVSKADTTVPGIMVKYVVPQGDSPDEIFTILIDGWHRARKLLDEGAEEMAVHFFDDPEMVMREFAWIRGRPDVEDPE